MMQKQRASRRSKDRQQAAVFAYCGLCGGEIYLGQLYYEMDDRLLCPECLPEYAKSYFLSRQAQYEQSAQLLRVRLSELRRQKKTAEDRQELFWLDRRMAALSQMLRQTNELAALTAHYYERGYYRNESYRI